MFQQLEMLQESPSQTAGPYVHIGLIPEQAGFHIFKNRFGDQMVAQGIEGERITIEGRVIDGSGTPVRDALLEIWQADSHGDYAGAGFRGWGRTGTDFVTGTYKFDTIKPGPVSGRGGALMAPHLNFWIVARGINIGLNTRMYFSDEEAANSKDPVLRMIEQEQRRDTLIAARSFRGGKTTYVFDIFLQGDRETVFFDI